MALERLQRRSCHGVPEPDRVIAEPDTTSLPSGEKATDLTQSEWPLSVCSAAPVVASQSLTVLSC
jgi:hypothetical protein